MLRRPVSLLATLTLVLTACSGGDDSLDGRDDTFTGDKADGFCADDGSVEAGGILALVNDDATTSAALDAPTAQGGAGLDRRAADNIVAARPFADLAQLDAVPFVGPATCQALRHFACDVQGLCATCQADTPTPPPSTTTFDGACPDLLLAIGQADVADSRSVNGFDLDQRCTQLDELERRAFDIVATEVQSPLDQLSGDDYFITARRLAAGGHDLQIVNLDDINSGMLWSVVFAEGQPIVTWDSDGLSDIAEWYCGTRPGSFTDSPSELCVRAFFDIPCDAARAQSHVTTSAAGAAAAGLAPSEVNALKAYVDDAGLTTDTELSVNLDRCASTESSRVAISRDGDAAVTYTVAEQPGGPMLLSRQTGDTSELLAPCSRSSASRHRPLSQRQPAARPCSVLPAIST